MHVVVHFMASWAGAEAIPVPHRDRALVTWAGFAPDLDGLGMLVDLGAKVLNLPELALYAGLHHQMLHGLFGALLIPALLCLAGSRRLVTFILGVLAVHLHLLCDLVGSRGPHPVDIWPIEYLQPFSTKLTFAWSRQWPINGWPNILFAVFLLGVIFFRTVTVGHSPLSMLSVRAHVAFVGAVRNRWNLLRRRIHRTRANGLP